MSLALIEAIWARRCTGQVDIRACHWSRRGNRPLRVLPSLSNSLAVSAHYRRSRATRRNSARVWPSARRDEEVKWLW